MQFFTLIPNMLFVLFLCRTMTKKIVTYRCNFNNFTRFSHFLHQFCPYYKTIQTFCPLSSISKDADFQGLSESELTFLGHHDSMRLQAKYRFSIIDPPSLVKDRSLIKSEFRNYLCMWSCRELFSASFETCPDSRRWTEAEKISKYYENMKRLLFCESPKKRKIGSFGIFHRYVRKSSYFEFRGT